MANFLEQYLRMNGAGGLSPANACVVRPVPKMVTYNVEEVIEIPAPALAHAPVLAPTPTVTELMPGTQHSSIGFTPETNIHGYKLDFTAGPAPLQPIQLDYPILEDLTQDWGVPETWNPPSRAPSTSSSASARFNTSSSSRSPNNSMSSSSKTTPDSNPDLKFSGLNGPVDPAQYGLDFSMFAAATSGPGSGTAPSTTSQVGAASKSWMDEIDGRKKQLTDFGWMPTP